MSDQTIPKNSHNESKTSQIIGIFTPSAFGITLYLLFFVLSIIINQISTNKFLGISSGYFEGTFIYKIWHEISKILSSSLINNISIYVFWLIIACFIYLIASRLTKNVDELAQDISIRGYILPKGRDKNQPIRELLEKLLFHFALAIILIFYLYKAGPFLVNLFKSNRLSADISLHNIVTFFILLLVNLIVLHIAVILIRLLLNRRRIVNI
jgi:hypothetical protein